MKFSPQQDKALLDFKHWYDSGCPGQVFHLFGFAGTGKTTLAIELAKGIEGTVLFGAFTGKASSVMQSKGCFGAKTIHSLIYKTKQKSLLRLVELEQQLQNAETENEKDQLRIEIKSERLQIKKPSFSLDENSAVKGATLLIVDEVSMIDEQIASDLLSFKTPILVLGDPAQLPPVRGRGYFMTPNPEIMLTDVHRTALDNPVLYLATRVRAGEPLAYGNYGEGDQLSRIVRSSELERGCARPYDQIIVGRNKTRVSANDSMRLQLGFAHQLPSEMDRVVCLKNDHNLGLMNGTLYNVRKVEDTGYEILLKVQPEEEGELSEEAGGVLYDIEAYREPFLGEETPYWRGERFHEFTYGYAITCHKSQGSEWPNVFIVDESSAFRSDHAKWLYTAITRASNKVMVVR